MRTILVTDAAKEVTIQDGKLLFGTHEVQERRYNAPEGSIAALYMLRYKDKGGNWSIMTGLDLVGNKFWLGGLYTRFFQNGEQVYLPSAFYCDFTTIARIIDTLGDTHYTEWQIFEEEDFDAQSFEEMYPDEVN